MEHNAYFLALSTLFPDYDSSTQGRGWEIVSLKMIEAQLWGGSPHKSDLRTGILGINSPQPSPVPPK